MSNPYPQQPEGARGGPPQYQAGGDQYGAHQGGHPGAAPPEVKRLLTLTLVSAAVYLLNDIVGIIAVTTVDTTEMYREMGLSADQIAAADQASGIGQITGIVMLVIALGLYALVYVFLKKGKNWARILGIVFAILGLNFRAVGAPLVEVVPVGVHGLAQQSHLTIAEVG